MMELKVGQYLLATCSQVFYEILRVDSDANGAPVIDLKVDDINDFIDREEWDELTPNLVYWQVDGPIIMKDLQYRFRAEYSLGADWIVVECNTPCDGCNRCVKSFVLRDSKDDYR
jgi:hypothetical protein